MKELKTRLQAANTLLESYAVPHGTETLSGSSKNLGREHEEKEDATRFPFQRDRDRIIHTQAFRRLKHKTQVFVAGKGDHYRTRLTHTMEVAQISRDMARTLGLNEDLAECIALAHDLGHTPFGHAGEDAMREEMEQRGGTFEHNLQSLRIVTLLEERSERYPGLNLNREVLEGLMKHRTLYDQDHGHSIPRSPSLEAQVVNLGDQIAYTAHDVDDGLRAEMLELNALRKIPLFEEAYDMASHSRTEARGSIIHILVSDAYEETVKQIAEQKIKTLDDVYAAQKPIVAFSPVMLRKLTELSEFLEKNFYFSPNVRTFSKEGKDIIHTLFTAYEKDPPKKVLELQKRTDSTLFEAVKDYIAGMTDQYAALMSNSIS